MTLKLDNKYIWFYYTLKSSVFYKLFMLGYSKAIEFMILLPQHQDIFKLKSTGKFGWGVKERKMIIRGKGNIAVLCPLPLCWSHDGPCCVWAGGTGSLLPPVSSDLPLLTAPRWEGPTLFTLEPQSLPFPLHHFHCSGDQSLERRPAKCPG